MPTFTPVSSAIGGALIGFSATLLLMLNGRIAGVCGIFGGAIGLGRSGMTQPSKVIGFLDFTGAWDPSLAFVMMGAIGAHVFFARRALTAKAPVLAEKFVFPERKTIDTALVVGSVIFGI